MMSPVSRRLAFAALIATACAGPRAQDAAFAPEPPGSASRRDALIAMAAKVRAAREAGRTHEYRGDWKVSIAVGPKRLTVRVADRIHRVGHDHDVTHVPAGVTPTRADLPT